MKAEFIKIRKSLGDGRASENAALELEKLIREPAERDRCGREGG